jgi:hypothetical protein
MTDDVNVLNLSNGGRCSHIHPTVNGEMTGPPVRLPGLCEHVQWNIQVLMPLLTISTRTAGAFLRWEIGTPDHDPMPFGSKQFSGHSLHTVALRNAKSAYPSQLSVARAILIKKITHRRKDAARGAVRSPRTDRLPSDVGIFSEKRRRLSDAHSARRSRDRLNRLPS